MAGRRDPAARGGVLVRAGLARWGWWRAGATCCVALASNAVAQPLSGPYVGLGAGVSLQQTLSHEAAPSLGRYDATGWQFDPGFAAEFGVGWGFGNGLR